MMKNIEIEKAGFVHLLLERLSFSLAGCRFAVCLLLLPGAMSLSHGAIIFTDNFTSANWQDSDDIPGFWSRTNPSSVTYQYVGGGQLPGRFLQVIESNTQGNRGQRFYSGNQSIFNFADQTIRVEFNDIQYILPETLGSPYGWYSAWGFTAEGDTRMEGPGADGIYYVHRFHSSSANSTIYLYAGETNLGTLTIPIEGLPVEGNRANLVLPVDIRLTVGPEEAVLWIRLSNGATHTLSGDHGFDPETTEWMESPVLNMSAFVNQAQGAGNPMGITMDSLTVSAVPEPVTAVLIMGLGVIVTAVLRKRRIRNHSL